MKKVLLAIILVSNTQAAFAASATGKAKQVVISALSISKNSDLEFGEAPQGDIAKTVAAGNEENPENASFTITGQPNKAITVSLPADNTVIMTTGTGDLNSQIKVNSFTSNFANANLDGTGSAKLFVGATRNQLLSNQTTGSYEGDFTVTVVY